MFGKKFIKIIGNFIHPNLVLVASVILTSYTLFAVSSLAGMPENPFENWIAKLVKQKSSTGKSSSDAIRVLNDPEAGLFYRADGSRRSATEAVEVLKSVVFLRRAFRNLPFEDMKHANNFLEQSFGVDLLDGLDKSEVRIMAEESNRILYDDQGRLRMTEEAFRDYLTTLAFQSALADVRPTKLRKDVEDLLHEVYGVDFDEDTRRPPVTRAPSMIETQIQKQVPEAMPPVEEKPEPPVVKPAPPVEKKPAPPVVRPAPPIAPQPVVKAPEPEPAKKVQEPAPPKEVEKIIEPVKKPVQPITESVVRVEPTTPQAPDIGIEEAEPRVRIWGTYRIGFGVGDDIEFNQSDSDLQDYDDNYLFGEDLNNTFDPGIYSQHLVNIDTELTDRISVFTQAVLDPWSYVGKTSETRVIDSTGADHFKVEMKYWGANNAILRETWRSNTGNLATFPVVEVENDKTVPFTVNGLTSFGQTYNFPELDVDFEFRPLRKAWVDYDGDNWHMRLFALADQDQIMTTDDPLGLSNTRDYWLSSPWLDQWERLKLFSDTSIERGHYSGELAYNAKDSEGNFLTLLRGVSFESDLGRTYVAGMFASPYGPWDEYQELNNIPGVLRFKHQLTPQWMVGGMYGFRRGFVDHEADAINQLISGDTRYALDPDSELYGQVAFTRDDIDLLQPGISASPDGLHTNLEGMAYRAGLNKFYRYPEGGTQLMVDLAAMGSKFRPVLSRYSQLRDDNHWDKHYVSFREFSPELEYYRIGTGLDIGRTALRVNTRTSLMGGRVFNLFDMRHVRDTESVSFIENVLRDELTYQMTPEIKVKGFTRWQKLPETVTDVEPKLHEFAFTRQPDLSVPSLQNTSIDPGLDPSTFTLGAGLQFKPNSRWTLEAQYTRSNDIPDFPRALQNDATRSTLTDPDNTGILLDNIQNLLYNQDKYGLPPYDYFSIVTERVIYQPADNLSLIFHAGQNSYDLWGPVDSAAEHQGISVDYAWDNKTSLFLDYTHSVIADIPRFVDTSYTELNFKDHHNVYTRLTRQVNRSAFLNIEYGVSAPTLGESSEYQAWSNPFLATDFALKTLDTEHLIRVSLEGEF